MEKFTEELQAQLQVDTAFTIPIGRGSWLESFRQEPRETAAVRRVARHLARQLYRRTSRRIGEAVYDLYRGRASVHWTFQCHRPVRYEAAHEGSECHGSVVNHEYFTDRIRRHSQEGHEGLAQELYPAGCDRNPDQYSGDFHPAAVALHATVW